MTVKVSEQFEHYAALSDGIIADLRQQLAAAEGERDALRVQLARTMALAAERAGHLSEAARRGDTNWKLALDEQTARLAAESALAEARGREKALREALAGLTDILNSQFINIECTRDVADRIVAAEVAARAALALPSSPPSPQGTAGAAAQQLSEKETK